MTCTPIAKGAMHPMPSGRWSAGSHEGSPQRSRGHRGGESAGRPRWFCISSDGPHVQRGQRRKVHRKDAKARRKLSGSADTDAGIRTTGLFCVPRVRPLAGPRTSFASLPWAFRTTDPMPSGRSRGSRGGAEPRRSRGDPVWSPLQRSALDFDRRTPCQAVVRRAASWGRPYDGPSRWGGSEAKTRNSRVSYFAYSPAAFPAP